MEISAWHLLGTGFLIVLSILSKAILDTLRLPDLLGYLLIGVGLSAIEQFGPVSTPINHQLLGFLGQVGVVALLFRIGLECDVNHLVRRLPGATRIWISNVTVSISVVLITCIWLLGWGGLPSVFVAVALTATGIGVSVRVWRASNQLDSVKGALMLDVAELDDLFGVLLLASLTALVPELRDGWSTDLLVPIVTTLGITLGKMGVLLSGGLLFARYLEASLTDWLHNIQPRPDMMITVLGVGLMVAGLTALLGFSAAIGGFFAGLIFSSDPLSVKIDASFDSLHDLFVPFFFIFVGLSIDLSVLADAPVAILAVLVAALLGKGLGSFFPVVQQLRPSSALAFSVALLPRSEITLIVMERGLNLGVVSQELFGIVVAVAALTMVGVPILLRGLLSH